MHPIYTAGPYSHLQTEKLQTLKGGSRNFRTGGGGSFVEAHGRMERVEGGSFVERMYDVFILRHPMFTIKLRDYATLNLNFIFYRPL